MVFSTYYILLFFSASVVYKNIVYLYDFNKRYRFSKSIDEFSFKSDYGKAIISTGITRIAYLACIFNIWICIYFGWADFFSRSGALIVAFGAWNLFKNQRVYSETEKYLREQVSGTAGPWDSELMNTHHGSNMHFIVGGTLQWGFGDWLISFLQCGKLLCAVPG